MSQTMQTAQPLPDEFHLLAEAHGLGQLKDSAIISLITLHSL